MGRPFPEGRPSTEGPIASGRRVHSPACAARRRQMASSQFQCAAGEGDGKTQRRVAPIRAPLSPKTAPRPRKRRPAARLVNARTAGWKASIFALRFGLRFSPQRPRRQLPVHAAHGLGEVGEAEAEGEQGGEFGGRDQSRCETDREERAPEFVLRMGVVGPLARRRRPRGGAAEDDCETRRQHVRKDGNRPLEVRWPRHVASDILRWRRGLRSPRVRTFAIRTLEGQRCSAGASRSACLA